MHPESGYARGSIYFGVYTLSNGESGNFILSVQNGTNAASGAASPEELPDNPVFIENGPATIALQINTVAGTGTGTIAFTSNGTPKTGTVIILMKIPLPPTEPITCGTPTPTPSVSPTPTPAPSPTPTPGGLVAIGGRVTTPGGLGLRNAVVSLTDGFGVRRTSTTSSFGNYQFTGVRTGEVHVLSVSSKRFRFTPVVQVFTASLTDLNLGGIE